MAEGLSLVVGVDEAGRGPVVGDMVVALAAFSPGVLGELAGLGVRDSKSLGRAGRRRLFPLIVSRSSVVASAYVSPPLIDRFNLNDLTVEYIGVLLRALPGDARVLRVVVDMVGGRVEAIRGVVRGVVGDVEVVVEEGADARYVEVAAASIVAKVLRDDMVWGLSRLFGEIGSGYPSDPRTVGWLRGFRGSAYIVRRSWGTVARVRPDLAGGQRSLLEFIG